MTGWGDLETALFAQLPQTSQHPDYKENPLPEGPQRAHLGRAGKNATDMCTLQPRPWLLGSQGGLCTGVGVEETS